MQLASSAAFPEPLLAAMPQLREKPHLGVPSKNPALHQVHEVCNSTTALGLQAALHLERIRSRYTGKERDNESGLDYFGARYLSSSMGRFMSPDTGKLLLTDPQSLNRYAYTRNTPLIYIDPSGKYWAIPPSQQDYFARYMFEAMLGSNSREMIMTVDRSSVASIWVIDNKLADLYGHPRYGATQLGCVDKDCHQIVRGKILTVIDKEHVDNLPGTTDLINFLHELYHVVNALPYAASGDAAAFDDQIKAEDANKETHDIVGGKADQWARSEAGSIQESEDMLQGLSKYEAGVTVEYFIQDVNSMLKKGWERFCRENPGKSECGSGK